MKSSAPTATDEAGHGPGAWQRVWPWLRRLLLAGFFTLVGWLIVKNARDIEWPQVLDSLQALPSSTLLACAGLAAASMLLYSCFDLLGRHYTGHSLPVPTVITVTFISYAFNLNLGSLIGGIAFRLRLYSRLGLDVGLVTRILSLSMVTNWLGYLLLAGVLFVLHPLPLPPTWTIDMQGLQWLGGLLVLIGLVYLGLCGFSSRREFHIRHHTIELPSWRMALLQAAMGMGNWLLLGSLMTLLMPATLDFATVQMVLLLAAVAGVITHVPAGLGVLEAVFVALLAHRVPRHELLASLLAYRLIYYLVPMAVAVVLYIVTEARARKLALTAQDEDQSSR